MPSPRPTDALGEVYAEWAVEMDRYPDMSIELLRIIFDDWQRVTAEPEDVTYRETTIGGVPGILVTPLASNPQEVLVLLHGGGFALGCIAQPSQAGWSSCPCHRGHCIRRRFPARPRTSVPRGDR